MYRKIVLIVLYTTAGALSSAQELPALCSSDLSAEASLKTRIFDGSSLWGYMNGGADLYLEYGFDKLTVQDIREMGKEVKVEVYKMQDAMSAYGIFSVLRYRCTEYLPLVRHSCITAYQVLFSKGSYLVSVVNQDGGERSLSLCRDLASRVAAKIEEEEYNLPDFHYQHFSSHEISEARLAKGRLGIQNGMPVLESLMGVFQGFVVIFQPVERDTLEGYFAYIHFTADPTEEVISGFGQPVPSGMFQRLCHTDESSYILIRLTGDTSDITDWVEQLCSAFNIFLNKTS